MEVQPEILPFVKAMTSAERLRIVGLLTHESKRAVDVASVLGVHVSDVSRHLEQLTTSGVVSEADGVYELNEDLIVSLARVSYDVKDGDVRKVLKTFLETDGRLKQILPMENKLLIILSFIVGAFDFNVNYTEKEVNTVLRRFYVDTATLRRHLVDHGFMARDGYGREYWRVNTDEK